MSDFKDTLRQADRVDQVFTMAGNLVNHVQEMEARLDALEVRFGERLMEIGTKFEALLSKMDMIDARLDKVEARLFRYKETAGS